MSKNTIPTHYRISKGTKIAMLGTAVLFDVLPLGVLLVSAGFIAYGLAGLSSCSSFLDSHWHIIDGAVCGLSLLAGGVSTGVFLVMFGPLLFLFLSAFIYVVAYFFVFPAWFFMKRVFVYEPTTGRLLTNLFCMLLKLIPIFGFFGITIWTWNHIHMTRKQDLERATDEAASVPGQVTRSDRTRAVQGQFAA
jgi:hypothetical protein